MTRDESGAGVVLAVAMMGLLVTLTVGVVCGVGVVAVHRSAQGAADLAALAAADALQDGGEACSVARAIAGANHAQLRRCRVDGWTVLVEVAVATRWPVSVPLPARARAGPVSAEAGQRSASSAFSRSSRLYSSSF